jgi:hypothetical protein
MNAGAYCASKEIRKHRKLNLLAEKGIIAQTAQEQDRHTKKMIVVTLSRY